MKPLPVIQPQSPEATPPAGESKTGHMVRDAAQTSALEPRVRAAIKTVFDPEIPVNVHDLGLIYDVIVDANAVVGVVMTLTAPACPAAQWLPGQVEQAVKGVEGVTGALVDVVFDPPWSKDRMSEAAKLQLGLW
jgi:FeS assembly SUF system protein